MINGIENKHDHNRDWAVKERIFPGGGGKGRDLTPPGAVEGRRGPSPGGGGRTRAGQKGGLAGHRKKSVSIAERKLLRGGGRDSRRKGSRRMGR